MALANKRRLAALAETAAALLAHHRIIQSLWRQRCRRASAGRIGNDRNRRLHVSDRREISGLLARIFRWSYLSLLLRNSGARAGSYARAGFQLAHCRRHLLRCRRLSTTARPRLVVSFLLDLLRARVSDQEFAWSDLSVVDLCLALAVLSRSAAPVRAPFPLGLHSALPNPLGSLVHRNRIAFPRIFPPAHWRRMDGTPAFVCGRSR